MSVWTGSVHVDAVERADPKAFWPPAVAHVDNNVRTCALRERDCSVHQTTIAAGVDLGALNELLLREGDEVAGGNEVSTLEGSGGGESPA